MCAFSLWQLKVKGIVMRLKYLEISILNRRSRVRFLRIVNQQNTMTKIVPQSTSFKCMYIVFLVLWHCENAINKYGVGLLFFFFFFFSTFQLKQKLGWESPEGSNRCRGAGLAHQLHRICRLWMDKLCQVFETCWCSCALGVRLGRLTSPGLVPSAYC